MFMKGFGDIFAVSWKEYKSNFRLFLKAFLLFAVLPTLIIYAISFGFFPSAMEDLAALGQIDAGEVPSMDSFPKIPVGYLIFSSVSGIGLGILSFLMYLAFYYLAIYKKGKMSLGQALKGGMKYFWAFLGLIIVAGLALMGLSLLLIIPGIIFGVYWFFSAFVLVGENKGIIDSMKRSKAIVKGMWWKVFGYLLLFILITIGISLIFSIPAGILSFIIGGGFTGLVEGTFDSITYLLLQVVNYIFNTAASIITLPLGILFFKNFYLELKGRKKR